MRDDICDGCPFVRDCGSCRFQGDPVARQSGSCATDLHRLSTASCGRDTPLRENGNGAAGLASTPRLTPISASEEEAAMKPTCVTVPLHFETFCGGRNPTTGKPCRRPENHAGRHAFIWRFAQPGRVREVWA